MTSTAARSQKTPYDPSASRNASRSRVSSMKLPPPLALIPDGSASKPSRTPRSRSFPRSICASTRRITSRTSASDEYRTHSRSRAARSAERRARARAADAPDAPALTDSASRFSGGAMTESIHAPTARSRARATDAPARNDAKLGRAPLSSGEDGAFSGSRRSLSVLPTGATVVEPPSLRSRGARGVGFFFRSLVLSVTAATEFESSRLRKPTCLFRARAWKV